MTASPIDAKMDVVQAASELECLLDSKIATTSDMSLTEAIKKPLEQIMRYDALPQAGYETELLRDVKSRYEHVPVFKHVFERAIQIARHLGRWCADSYILHAFGHDKAGKYEMDIEKKFHARRVQHEIIELDNAVQEIREAIEYVQTRRDVLDKIGSADYSSKVRELHRYLQLQFERTSDHRCIVFVDRRYTARMLHNLFMRLATSHMRGHFLVGSNNGGLDEDTFTFKQQVLTLMKFRKGEINCLFATSVAEEGLDVPDCNLIIRFDMYTTMIQYVQSRGRARNRNSKFIHMIENGNSIHSQTLNDVRYAEQVMRKYCDLLPEDRKLQGNQDNLEVLLEREGQMETLIDPLWSQTYVRQCTEHTCALRHCGPDRKRRASASYLCYSTSRPKVHRRSHAARRLSLAIQARRHSHKEVAGQKICSFQCLQVSARTQLPEREPGSCLPEEVTCYAERAFGCGHESHFRIWYADQAKDLG